MCILELFVNKSNIITIEFKTEQPFNFSCNYCKRKSSEIIFYDAHSMHTSFLKFTLEKLAIEPSFAGF